MNTIIKFCVTLLVVLFTFLVFYVLYLFYGVLTTPLFPF